MWLSQQFFHIIITVVINMKDKFYEKYRNLGISITYFRRMQGLTQQTVADRMDISYETMSRIENANTGMSMDMMYELSEALKIPLSELFNHAKQ